MVIKSNGKQFHKASEILKGLRADVTPQDRKDAMQDLRLSEPTISSYLNGNARNLDTAERLIVFFRGRINRRAEVFTSIR